MPVNFITNDPMAVGAPPPGTITPLAIPAGARVAVKPIAPVGLFPRGTPQFNFWQLQTALIHGLNTWQALSGAFLPRWQNGNTTLPAFTDKGDDLNAFYDRASLQFFHHSFQGRTVFSCASEDVAVHELGHGLLDAIRPDFFAVPFIEAGALHEAFGDCFALLTALRDGPTRTRLLALSPTLGGHQFVERLAEELGDAIRREFGAQNVEPGALRRALNTFQWKDPLTLPANAPAAQLSREVHSFSRVFTGCFYDVIRNIYAAGPQTSANLLAASTVAGKLLIAALRTVPATARLFKGVGQRMVQADAATNGGVNVARIRAAFAAHSIVLAAPMTSLTVPIEGAEKAAMASLRGDLGVAGRTAIEVTPVDSDLHPNMAHVSAYEARELTGAALKGISISVPAVARVTMRGNAIVGMVGNVEPVSAEVGKHAQAFAESLLANGDLKGAPEKGRRYYGPASHRIKKVGSKRTIVRVGYACGCRGWHE